MLHTLRLAAARPLRAMSHAWRLGLSLTLAATPALVHAAAPPAGKSTASGSSGSKGPVRPGPSGKKVISLDDEFLVEGQLEKPSAFYVLRRSSTDHDWAREGATMVPLVLESVSDPLF